MGKHHPYGGSEYLFFPNKYFNPNMSDPGKGIATMKDSLKTNLKLILSKTFHFLVYNKVSLQLDFFKGFKMSLLCLFCDPTTRLKVLNRGCCKEKGREMSFVKNK